MTTTTTRKTTPRKAVTRPASVTEANLPPETQNRPEPQDHKPKAEKSAKPVVKQVEGGKEITHHGFTVTVDDDALNDFELLGDMRRMDDTKDPSFFPQMLRRLLGDDGFRVAMDGLRNPETGRVSAPAGVQYVEDVFEAIAPNS